MPTYFDSKGKPYQINQPIGRGGEGTVFYCPDDMSVVAKIYHEPIDDEKAGKLRWMAANSNDKLLKVAAWIVDTLHDEPDGKVVGFLMPNVRAKEIHELYSLKSRRVHFPDATWQFLVHAATNVARAFHNLHRHDHVMGDVNHGNCVVLADGTVKLIDCDSYSIKTDKLRYRCDVGVATHLAPELQGVDLSEIERHPNHDNFGLAVIIFQLLFLGRHPFAGNYVGQEDKSLEDCIREHRFAYGGESSVTMVKQPPGTLSLSQITPRLKELFEQAFLTETRPEPRDWIEALEDLGKSLNQCPAHIGHYYYKQLSSCPWCEIEAKTGLMLFPFVGSGKMSEDAFNIFTVENLIASIEIPHELPPQPVKTNTLPMPSQRASELRDQNNRRLIVVSAIQAVIVLFMTAVAGAGFGFFVGAVTMIAILVAFHNRDRATRESIEAELYDAQLKWKEIEKDWAQREGTAKIENDLDLIRDRVKEHREIQLMSGRKVKELKDEMFAYKLDRYLSSFRLKDSGLAGLSPEFVEKATRYGVGSASDVNAKALDRIPLIDPKLKESILDWREELERKYEFDGDEEIPEAEMNRFNLQFAERRRTIEREIETLLISLRSSSAQIQHRHGVLGTRATQVSQAMMQAQSDLSAIGTTTPLIVSLIFLTALIPMFGAAIQSAVPMKDSGAGGITSKDSNPRERVKPPVGISSDDSNYQVMEGLSDEKIAVLESDTRERSAKSLYNQATKLLNKKEYAEAEKRLRYGLRFKFTDDSQLLLAKALYLQKKVPDAYFAMSKVSSARASEEDGLVLSARILIARGDPKGALDAMETAFTSNPSSAQVLLVRGLAKRELNQIDEAIQSISNAINLDPNLVEAHYELGVTFVVKGDLESAKLAYDSVKTTDNELASDLLMKIEDKKTGASKKGSR